MASMREGESTEIAGNEARTTIVRRSRVAIGASDPSSFERAALRATGLTAGEAFAAVPLSRERSELPTLPRA